MSDKKSYRITLAGEGGQGLQSIGEILARCASDAGLYTSYIPNFGVEKRGGVSIAFVQISDKPISSPRFDNSDIVIAMSERSIKRVEYYETPDTLLIYDSTLIPEVPVTVAKHVVGIPATDIARAELTPKVFNVLVLGFLIGLTGIITLDTVENAFQIRFKKYYEKNPGLHELNLKALARGIEEGKKITASAAK